jgi:hypothetical protein
MNLNEVKRKLDSLTKTKGSSTSEKKNVFFKPSIGKQIVRVVPSKYNKDIPFTEMAFYYEMGKIKSLASPSNWGDKDPIKEFTKQLRQSNDKENWRLAKKLDPKTRVFVPVVVRGEESEGVKLWQFGKETYQDFLNLAADDDIGDFTNILEGRDIKLNTVGPEVTGTAYNKTTLSPALKISVLSEDKEEVKKFLEEQPDPLQIFKKFTFEEVKQALQDWLTPEEETENPEEKVTEPVEEVKETKPEPKKSSYSLKDNTKKNKSTEFDSLFDEEE